MVCCGDAPREGGLIPPEPCELRAQRGPGTSPLHDGSHYYYGLGEPCRQPDLQFTFGFSPRPSLHERGNWAGARVTERRGARPGHLVINQLISSRLRPPERDANTTNTSSFTVPSR